MSGSADDTTVIAERRARAAKNDDYRNRRTVMLEQAAVLFHTNGISETSISDIAAAAGLDRATVYYYFPNKEAIVAEVVREAVIQSTASVAAVANSGLAPADKLRAMIVVSMQLFDHHYPHLFVFLREDMVRSVPESFRLWLEETQQAAAALWRNVIEEGKASGVFATDLDVDSLLAAVLGALNRVAHSHRPESGVDPAVLGAGVAQLVLNGLLSR